MREENNHRFILSTIEHHNNWLNDLQSQVTNTRIDVAVIKAKAWMIGAIAGFLFSLLGQFLISLYKHP